VERKRKFVAEKLLVHLVLQKLTKALVVIVPKNILFIKAVFLNPRKIAFFLLALTPCA